jgi:c(7)-type cytochrome triheme protein
MRRLFLLVSCCLLLAGVVASPALGAEGDVVFKRQGSESETPPAVFPHWSHRIRYKCYACHPGLFKMQANSEPITMDEIMAGKSCGACHNGTVAWPVTFETCDRCHMPR